MSWQLVSMLLIDLVTDADPEIARKATAAMMMKKIDIEALRQAVK